MDDDKEKLPDFITVDPPKKPGVKPQDDFAPPQGPPPPSPPPPPPPGVGEG